MPELVLFEDDGWTNFEPLASTRHLSQQAFGTGTLLHYFQTTVERNRSGTVGPISLAGRRYIAELEKQRTGLAYNDKSDGRVVLVNSRVNPLALKPQEWLRVSSGKVILDVGGDVAVASVEKADLERATSPDGSLSRAALRRIAKKSDRVEPGHPILFGYAWELLLANDQAIRASVPERGERVHAHRDATIEEFVSLDTREGPIIVDQGARLESFSRISGPCFIGKDCTILSALVRGGTSILEGCKVGGEVAHSLIYRRSNKAHFGYLGYSIIGEWVNVGAGAVTSDLKNTYGTVRVRVGNRDRVDTGQVKMGAMVGDASKISIGTMIYGGKTLGVAARAAGLVDHDVDSFTNLSPDGSEEMLGLDQILTTQSRMKARRGEVLSKAERTLFDYLYSIRVKSQKERA